LNIGKDIKTVKGTITVLFQNIFFLTLNSHNAMTQTQMNKLPEPVLKGTLSLEEAIAARRSRRQFEQRILDPQQISQLLWAAQGILDPKRPFRAAPSSGALFPMEVYVLNGEGFSHYDPLDHSLELITAVDMRRSLSHAAFDQQAVLEAPLNIMICAEFSRVTQKYIHHGVKYVHMEAGHIAQNVHLQAVALGLASVPVGAFDADAVKEILPIAEEFEPLYIIPVGYAK
jgi:SagB-type dehydrogenase family enzyme